MVRENTRNISNSIEEHNKLLKKQSLEKEQERKKSEKITDIKNTLRSTILEEKLQHNFAKIDFLNESMKDSIIQLVLQKSYSNNKFEIAELCEQYYLQTVSNVFKLEEAEKRELKRIEKENKKREEIENEDTSELQKKAIIETIKIIFFFFLFLLAFPLALVIAAVKNQK